jgi:hypothetical protein
MAAAKSTVKEDKTVKVVIDGVSMKISSAAIINDSALMLSTEYFTALGIPSKGLTWDKSKKNLTATKGKTVVKFAINSSTAYLNGKKVNLSVKPITYKGKAYFPADFVANCFDKKMVGYADTNTYFIINNADYTKNQELLNKILISMNSISKLKANSHVTLNVSGDGLNIGLVTDSSSLTDIANKTFISNAKYKQTMLGQEYETNVKAAIVNGQFCMQTDGGEWQKQTLDAKDLEETFNFNTIINNINVISAAAKITKSTNSDEIVIKLNTNTGATISTFLATSALTDTKFILQSTEITVDKTTNYIKKIVLKAGGSTTISGKSYNFLVDYKIDYTDINGNFDIEIPAELK